MMPSLRNVKSPFALQTRRDHSAKLTNATSGEGSIYRDVNPFCDERLAEGLHDFLGHLLGVAEQHHRIVAIEELVVDAGIADAAHRALHEHTVREALDGR